jgi:hypothetical protein
MKNLANMKEAEQASRRCHCSDLFAWAGVEDSVHYHPVLGSQAAAYGAAVRRQRAAFDGAPGDEIAPIENENEIALLIIANRNIGNDRHRMRFAKGNSDPGE